MTFNSAVPSQGTCSQSAGTVTCPLGTIANGANASVQITVTPQSTGSITNSASASSAVSDPNSANNTASAATTVNPAANLSLTKTDSPDPVLQGQELTYTLGVSNAGPSSATSVVVTDTLPAGVTFNSGHAHAGQLRQHVRHRHVLARDHRQRREREHLDQGHAAVHGIDHELRQASRPAVGDPIPANNSASASTTVNPVADLSITKSDSPDPVSSGQQLTYTLARPELRALGRDRRDRHRHAARRRHLQLRHAVAGHLLAGERHRHLQPRCRGKRRERERRASW